MNAMKIVTIAAVVAVSLISVPSSAVASISLGIDAASQCFIEVDVSVPLRRCPAVRDAEESCSDAATSQTTHDSVVAADFNDRWWFESVSCFCGAEKLRLQARYLRAPPDQVPKLVV